MLEQRLSATSGRPWCCEYMIRFEQIDCPPADMRNAYLDSLLEPQELYLEMHVEAGRTWCIPEIAYAVQCGKKLVELYVVPDQANRVIEIFDSAMITSGASGVLCKSYDTQLLYGALSKPSSVHPGGLLFRRISDRTYTPREDATFRQGNIDDAELIFTFNDEFFQSLDEIRQYAVSDGLFVLEKDGGAIGCGIGKRVVENRSDIDIGMLVANEHRRNGYGAHIISFLKNHYLEQALRPICGCSIENTGSQRALMNAGFISEHSLVEITY